MEFIGKINYFTGKTSSIDEIRTKLIQFEGGEITCDKNHADGIAKICINHPEKKNAITGKMMIDLENIVNDLETWINGKGIILYGINEMFCSGGDLDYAREENNAKSGYEMATFMHNILNKFSNLPLISVAFIEGGAIGGGAELSTACDFRLCSANSNTRIGFVHAKMGIVPAWGGTTRLVQIVGKRKALDLLLSGIFVNSAECYHIGLADGIVYNFQQVCDWISNKIIYDVSVVRATKACIINAAQIDDNIWENEKRIFSPLWGAYANEKALQMNIKHK